MSEDKKYKVIFVPGCLDDFEGTQEELDRLVEYIHEIVDTEEMFAFAEEINLDELEDGEVEAIKYFFNDEHSKDRIIQ